LPYSSLRQLGGGKDLCGVVPQEDVHGLVGFALEDDSVVAAALELGPEVPAAGGLAPYIGQWRACSDREAAGAGEAYAREGTGREDEQVVGVQRARLQVAPVEKELGRQARATDEVTVDLLVRLELRRFPGGEVDLQHLTHVSICHVYSSSMRYRPELFWRAAQYDRKATFKAVNRFLIDAVCLHYIKLGPHISRPGDLWTVWRARCGSSEPSVFRNLTPPCAPRRIYSGSGRRGPGDAPVVRVGVLEVAVGQITIDDTRVAGPVQGKGGILAYTACGVHLAREREPAHEVAKVGIIKNGRLL
jgi:hypothetical protein